MNAVRRGRRSAHGDPRPIIIGFRTRGAAQRCGNQKQQTACVARACAGRPCARGVLRRRCARALRGPRSRRWCSARNDSSPLRQSLRVPPFLSRSVFYNFSLVIASVQTRLLSRHRLTTYNFPDRVARGVSDGLDETIDIEKRGRWRSARVTRHITCTAGR